MTQKDLATKCNSTPKIIAEYENGSASSPDNVLLGKIERALGVKLRGAIDEIGSPLGGPKKK